MRMVADLHIHSSYSRATGKNNSPGYLDRWARIKGIDLLGTGDCTHPRWLGELRDQLEEDGEGLYVLKRPFRDSFEAGPALTGGLPRARRGPPRFVLTGEISTIYKAGERTRKIHHLVLLPDFKAAGALQIALERRGNISSDGRPILGIDSRELLAILLDADDRALLIPAHIWTPWFSALGGKSGFDSIEACYGDLSARIPAVETGLSSNPPMNWALSALDTFGIISNSDAHSPEKLGREATIFAMEPSYRGLYDALWSVRRGRDASSVPGEAGEGAILGTIEFFPQEGKYHYDGHRKCGVYLSPGEALAAGGRCPVCGKDLTRGVMGRVRELADRPVDEAGLCPRDYRGGNRRPYHSLIPLKEILAEIQGTGPAAKGVGTLYDRLIERAGCEFALLLDMDLGAIEKLRCPGLSGELLAAAIGGMRRGKVWVSPGYDGEYGVIRVFPPGKKPEPCLGAELFTAPPDTAPPTECAATPDTAPQGARCAATPDAEPPAGCAATPDTAPRAAECAALPDTAPQGAETAAPPPGARFSPDETQAGAIGYAGTHALIVAGPGTGKTAVLAARIARLLRIGRDPASVLALSFTVKAAAELRERIAAEAGGLAPGVTTATFHSLCRSILREQPPGRGLPRDFRVLGDAARDQMLGEILDEAAAALPGKKPGKGGRGFSVQSLGEYIEGRKRFLLRPGEGEPTLALPPDAGPLLPAELLRSGGPPAAQPEAEALYGRYRDRQRAGGFLDFDDLLAGTVRLLAGSQAVREGYRARYRHILVDEYQDLNITQYLLLRLLAPPPDAGEGAELWVIGDPNQAIYGFRGADKAFIDRFLQDYPGAARFRLKKSFRCAVPIIRAAGRLAEAPLEGVAAAASLSRGVYPTAAAEAEGIARRIARLFGGASFFALDSGTAGGDAPEPEGTPLGENAVLLRGAALAGPILKALGDHGIPFVFTGERPWWEEEPISALLTELRQGSPGPPGPPLEAVRALWERMDREGRLKTPRKSGGPALSLRGERLFGLAALYEDLPSLLDALALSGTPGDDPGGAAPEKREGVRVMTIHAAKGLEFDHVFIPALEEGLLPFTLYEDPGRVSGAAVAEERRLLYVAMTRARLGLHLSRAESRTFRGRPLKLGPSRFLADLEDLLPEERLFSPRRDPQLPLF
jgi:uncharacterized protein (TIGR00375 family)